MINYRNNRQYITLLIESLQNTIHNDLSHKEAIWRSTRLLKKASADIGALIIGLSEILDTGVEDQKEKCVICPNVGGEGLLCLENHFTCKDCIRSWFQFNLDKKNIDTKCPGYTDGQWCDHSYNPTTLTDYISSTHLESYQKLSLSMASREDRVLKCTKCKYWVVYHPSGLKQMGGMWVCDKCKTVMCYECDPPISLGEEWAFFESVARKCDHYHRKPPEQIRSCISEIISTLELPIQCPSCKIDVPQRENPNNIFRCPQCYFWFCFFVFKRTTKR